MSSLFQGLNFSATSSRAMLRISVNDFCRGRCEYCFIPFRKHHEMVLQNIVLVRQIITDLSEDYSQIVVIVEDADPFVDESSLQFCKQLAEFATESCVSVIEFFMNRKDTHSVKNAHDFARHLQETYPASLQHKFCFSGTFLLSCDASAFQAEVESVTQLVEEYSQHGFDFSLNFAPQPNSLFTLDSPTELSNMLQLAVDLHVFSCLYMSNKLSFSIALLPATHFHDEILKDINDFSRQLQTLFLQVAVLSLSETTIPTVAYLPFQQEGLVQALTGSTNCYSGLNCWEDHVVRLAIDGTVDTCLFPLHGSVYSNLKDSFQRSSRRFQLQSYRASFPFVHDTNSGSDAFFRGGCPMDRVAEHDFSRPSYNASLLASRYRAQYQMLLHYDKHPSEIAKMLLEAATAEHQHIHKLSFSQKRLRWQDYCNSRSEIFQLVQNNIMPDETSSTYF